MSGFISEPTRTDEDQVATSSHGNPEHPLQHRRHISSKHTGPSNSVAMDSSKAPEAPLDISAGQKMLSAVSGSLLTSLLGTYIPQRPKLFQSPILIVNSHTIRCRPCAPAISTPSVQRFYPESLFEVHKSSCKYRGYGLLPRSLLGK